MKIQATQRAGILVCSLILLLANIACAQKVLAPEPIHSPPTATVAEAPKAEPILSREEWTRRHEAYRAKKKEFLTRLRQYIEINHTDPSAFEKLMGPLVGGKYTTSIWAYTNRTVRLMDTQLPLESASWSNSVTPDSPMKNLFINLSVVGSMQAYYATSPDTECVTEAEIAEMFSKPNWTFIDTIRRDVHTQINTRTFTSKKMNAQGLQPQFSLERLGCVFYINIDFLKE
jgi:hypothetical protein